MEDKKTKKTTAKKSTAKKPVTKKPRAKAKTKKTKVHVPYTVISNDPPIAHELVPRARDFNRDFFSNMLNLHDAETIFAGIQPSRLEDFKKDVNDLIPGKSSKSSKNSKSPKKKGFFSKFFS